ncbi:PREDICTED: uncharacterized protein LOC108447579 [Corvus brachyrhynchos]|uniref:uncharacterized protein LOC108447579 n=1 Tax=Corvus brachyrhynchos TaxID=85066 RepID=UPI0008164118|nr:PREDICTED: uncharacterized protein LOC108447579 [Corvus brachyrhynchos]
MVVGTAVGNLPPSCGTPRGRGEKFKKGLLKKLVRWLFFHFPRVSPGDVALLHFWNMVGATITQKIRAQVERQVENQDMDLTIILKVAKENANESCKRVIAGLPVYPEPMLPALVDACMKKASTMDPRPPPRRPIPPMAMAIQPQVPAQNQSTKRPRGDVVCFYCQGVGHIFKFGPKRPADVARERAGRAPTPSVPGAALKKTQVHSAVLPRMVTEMRQGLWGRGGKWHSPDVTQKSDLTVVRGFPLQHKIPAKPSTLNHHCL